MNNQKSMSPQWILLPILFSSASVLAGGFGGEAISAADQATALSADSDGFLDETQERSSAAMGYVGGNTRIGVGFDTDFKGRIDGSHVFSYSDDSATSGSGWIGVNPQADDEKHEELITGAGARINHHWVGRDESGNASHVNKVFGAYDQNEAEDKKVTAGYGQERQNMFWSGHISKSLSDKRISGQHDTGANSSNATNSGAHIYEKAYDYGVGARVGTFMDGSLLRIQGGLDYEWGAEQADKEDTPAQLTVSGGVEKFFYDSPHSIGANVGVSSKSGGYVGDEHEADVSGNISYRYDFGNAGLFASDEQYRRVRVEIPGQTEVVKVRTQRAPTATRCMVKHSMKMDANTFFHHNNHHLTPAGQQRLRTMLSRIRNGNCQGRIRVIGDACACNDGTQHARNALAKRRAVAVRDFMIKSGFSANEIQALGFNEAGGSFVTTGEDRVVIEYMAQGGRGQIGAQSMGAQAYDVQERTRVISEPRVVWRKELIQSGPAWVGQALRNNIDYKQTIDTYRTLGADAIGGGAVSGGVNNTAPIAVNDSVSTEFNTAVMLDVTLNDSDVDGDTLFVVASGTDTSTSNGGIVELLDNGKLMYTPAVDFSGTDTFTYTVSDGNGNNSTATVEVVVNGSGANGGGDGGNTGGASNVAPVAVNDSASTAFNTQVMIDVLNNDSDADGDTVTILDFAETSANGGTIIRQDGKLFYTPQQGFSGTDSFVYTISDGNGNEANATVTIDVAADTATGSGGAGLVASDDSETTKAGTGVAIDVMSNDSDSQGDTITIQSHDSSSVNGGTVVKQDGMLVFTPAAGFSGTDTFDYTITDNNGETATATVTVTVQAVEEPPKEESSLQVVDDGTQGEVPGDSYSFYSNQTATRSLEVLNNDKGDELEIVSITTPPRFGTAAISSDGKSVNYTLRSGYCEDHFFVYKVRDKHGNEAEARVNINIIDDGKTSTGSVDGDTGGTDTNNGGSYSW